MNIGGQDGKMNEHKILSLGLVIFVFMLAGAATFFGDYIDEKLLGALTYPAFVLSIFESLRNIYIGAYNRCYNKVAELNVFYKVSEQWLKDGLIMLGQEDFDKDKKALETKQEREKNKNEMLMYIDISVGIEKNHRVIGYGEAIVFSLLLLCIALRLSFPLAEGVVAFWSLAVMIFSFYYGPFFSEKLVNLGTKKYQKKVASTEQANC